MHFIFHKKHILYPLKRWNLNSACTSASSAVPCCNILDLDINKEILRSDLDHGFLNKSVKIVLSENIHVPKVSLLSVSRIRRDFDGKFNFVKKYLHETIKVGYFTPLDKALIVGNTEALLDNLSVTCRKKNNVLKEIFSTNDEDEYHLEKIHILGLYLSQGMKDIRLPCDVFQTARILHLSNKDNFSDKEDEIIKKYMNNESHNLSTTPYADLSKKLNRSASSIQSRYNQILKVKSKSDVFCKSSCITIVKTSRSNKTYSKAENFKIMKAVFDVNKNVLKGKKMTTTADVWKQLSVDLDRSPANICCHWNDFILKTLLRHQSDVLHIDFREQLIEYCVENKIMFSKEANWDEIVSNPMFRGSTSSHLKRIYGTTRSNTKRKYPNIPDHEVTSETMSKYLSERKVQSPKRKKDIEDLLMSFEELKFQLEVPH